MGLACIDGQIDSTVFAPDSSHSSLCLDATASRRSSNVTRKTLRGFTVRRNNFFFPLLRDAASLFLRFLLIGSSGEPARCHWPVRIVVPSADDIDTKIACPIFGVLSYLAYGVFLS